ncbi:MAG: gliding motility-associated C-terminal domain-containing protein [Bacteroidota bacterium]
MLVKTVLVLAADSLTQAFRILFRSLWCGQLPYIARHAAAWLLCCLLTVAGNAQDCFDPSGDCTSSNPQQFELEIEVSCGDTVFLPATQELCNTWTIPDGVQSFPGLGQDSAAIFVIIDRCDFPDITVDGLTETPSGSGTASCNRKLIYQLFSVPDTTTQGLDCASFFALESTSVMLTSSCGCDSLLVNYFNLGGADTTYVDQFSCNPDDVGVEVVELVASTGCDSVVIQTTQYIEPDELFIEDQLACAGETAVLWAFQDGNPTYSWSTGEVGESIEIEEPGVYSVTTVDSEGCVNVASANVEFSEIGITLIPSIAGPLVLSDNPLQVWEGAAIQMDLEVSGTPHSYEVVWNGGPQIGDDSTFNYVATKTDFFKVGVIDSLGCFAIDSVFVEVKPIQFFAPTAFSPNDDGNNDQYEIFTSPNVEEMRLQIFSRNGGMVYDQILLEPELLPNSLRWPAWNGEFRGRRMDPQVFAFQLWYRAIRGEWRLFSGDLTLSR